MNSVSIVAAFYLDSQMDSGPLGPLSEGFQFPAAQQLRLSLRAALAVTSLQIEGHGILLLPLSLTAKLFEDLLVVTWTRTESRLSNMVLNALLWRDGPGYYLLPFKPKIKPRSWCWCILALGWVMMFSFFKYPQSFEAFDTGQLNSTGFE